MAVLVADDHQFNRHLLRTLLERLGHGVLEARDGIVALSQLEENPEVDVLILDIGMPRLNGWGVLARLRERPEWRELPVVLCTAVAERETVQRALGFGVRHYLVKPVNADRVRQAVDQALASAGPRLQPAAAALARLSVDVGQYTAQLRALAELVDGLIASPSGDAIKTELLRAVHERCTGVGAERSAAVAWRLLGGAANQAGVTTRDTLLRELRLLRPAIDERIASLGTEGASAPATPAAAAPAAAAGATAPATPGEGSAGAPADAGGATPAPTGEGAA